MTTCEQCDYEEKETCRFNPQVDGRYPTIDLKKRSCGQFQYRRKQYKRQDHIPEEPAVDITKPL